MKAENVKIAAVKLSDLERISQARADIEAGSAFSITIGPSIINVQANSEPGAELRRTIAAFLDTAIPAIEEELTKLGVEEPDNIDKAIEALDREAQPNGAPN